MTATFMPVSSNRESHKRGLLLFCVFLFPIVFTSIIFLFTVIIGDINLKVVGSVSEFAKIDSPKNRSQVKEKFTISGSIKKSLVNNHYFLMEHRENVYWPKFYLGKVETNWSHDVTHRAKKDKYATYLVVNVNAALKDTYINWFETSKSSGKYPSFSNLSDGEIVASIRVRGL